MRSSTTAVIGTALGFALSTARADLVKSPKHSVHKREPYGDYTLSDNLVFADKGQALGIERLTEENSMQTYLTFTPEGDLSKIRFQAYGDWDHRVFANAVDQQLKLVDDAEPTKWNASQVGDGVWHIMDGATGLAWDHAGTSGPIGLSKANAKAEGQQFKMHQTITLRGVGGSEDDDSPRKVPVKKQAPSTSAVSSQPAKPSSSGRADDGPFTPENLGTNGVYRMETSGQCPHVVPVNGAGIRAVRRIYGAQDQWEIKRQTFRGDMTATFQSVQERQRGRPAFLSVKNDKTGELALGSKPTEFKIEDGHNSGIYVIREPKSNRVLATQQDCGALVLVANGQTNQPWGFKKVA